MAITKAELIAFVNAAYAGAYSGTDLDEALALVLEDLAGLHVLIGTDTTATLAAGATYFAYPDDALDTDRAVIKIVLTDATAWAPLKWLPGGWTEYNRLMEGNSGGGAGPTHYVSFDRKIYVWPAPGEDDTYTISLDYYKRHQALASGIEFNDAWKNALKFGAAYYHALLKASAEYIALWESKYLREKDRMRMTIPRDLTVAGGVRC